jgi:hypothetical protein
MNPDTESDRQALARLVRELEEGELYAQALRAAIVAIRDAIAAGEIARALSLCHQAINEIDSATDVAAPSPRQKSADGP